MKPTRRLATGVIAALGLGLAVTAIQADPGHRGGGTGAQKQSGMQHAGKGGARHGAAEGHQHGSTGAGGDGRGHGAGNPLMSAEERTAFREKMRNASPEERQQIAAAHRAEMQKRAQERGVTPREGRGPRGGAATQAPATTEHQH